MLFLTATCSKFRGAIFCTGPSESRERRKGDDNREQTTTCTYSSMFILTEVDKETGIGRPVGQQRRLDSELSPRDKTKTVAWR